MTGKMKGGAGDDDGEIKVRDGWIMMADRRWQRWWVLVQIRGGRGCWSEAYLGG